MVITRGKLIYLLVNRYIVNAVALYEIMHINRGDGYASIYHHLHRIDVSKLSALSNSRPLFSLFLNALPNPGSQPSSASIRTQAPKERNQAQPQLAQRRKPFGITRKDDSAKTENSISQMGAQSKAPHADININPVSGLPQKPHADFHEPETLSTPGTLSATNEFATSLDDAEAVRIAYASEIREISSVLQAKLSALVYCDKLVTNCLWQAIIKEAGLKEKVVDGTNSDANNLAITNEFGWFRSKISEGDGGGEVLILANLDLLAGGPGGFPTAEAREITQLVYRYDDRLMLAFADPTITIPEMLANRFAVRRFVQGVPPRVVNAQGETILVGAALITQAEAACFQDFDPAALYKNIAGMNPLQVRYAIRYAIHEHEDERPIPAKQLYQAIRRFKVRSSAAFEVPDVRFEDIGGYHEIKQTLLRALDLMEGAYQISNEALRKELIPKGFILHGPPGTGKTYLAKAVANQLNANVVVVSGPEVINMYLGESERHVRELFAEARRNAPSVLIFDEFDAIAGQRVGSGDSGSRAQNAMVAQILTEMDGFRPEVQMLVIGTTNRIDIIDEALLRPSRFQSLAIGLPDADARREIARIHARRFEVDLHPALLEQIVKSTENFNGDEIRSLFRDAFVARHTGGTIRDEAGNEISDAYLFGRLVRQVRNRLEDEQKQTLRRTTMVRVLSNGGMHTHGERGRQAVPGMIEITPEAG